MMSKLLTAEQLGEIRKRHEHVCMIGKRTGREHQQSLAHSDRHSLLDHIDALQGELDQIAVAALHWIEDNSRDTCHAVEIQEILVHS